MSIMEAETIDMAAILTKAYALGDTINSSVEVAEYLYWKTIVKEDQEAQELVKLFGKKKELFTECERFGHFHPDYHAALKAVEEAQIVLNNHEAIARFKAAEEKLDMLLQDVSLHIAYAVSQSVKVPGNKLAQSGGCSTGSCSTGGCSGKCG